MALSKRTTETNTLALIHQWSMDGARGDLEGRFGSSVDILAIVAERGGDPSSDVPPPAPSPVLMKPADEDDWRPLYVGVPDAA